MPHGSYTDLLDLVVGETLWFGWRTNPPFKPQKPKTPNPRAAPWEPEPSENPRGFALTLGFGLHWFSVTFDLRRWVQPKLYLSDDKMVLDYANEVNRLGEERGCEAAVEELEQVAVKWSGHDPDAAESPVLQASMDEVMARGLGVLLEAEKTVVGKPKVQSKATQAKRKELWSQAAKPTHRRVRRLKELLALYDKGYYRSIWRKVQCIEQEEKLEGMGTKDVLGTARQRKSRLYRVKGDLLTLYRELGTETKTIWKELEKRKYKWIKQKRAEKTEGGVPNDVWGGEGEWR